MKFSIIVKGASLAKMFKGVETDNLRQTLEDAGQIVINSTKVGYQKQKGPDGQVWSDNPSWYKVMKGGSAPLTGPTSVAIKGGPLAGKYNFASVNTKRMRNSLIKEVSVAQKTVTVKYDRDAEARAEITQKGGESKIVLNSTSGTKSMTINVKVIPRPHLGIAEKWQRLGFKTDVQHIHELFGGMVDDILED
jgi:hypothetical protein